MGTGIYGYPLAVKQRTIRESIIKGNPAISVFGSARTAPSDPDYALAEGIGAGIARSGYAV